MQHPSRGKPISHPQMTRRTAIQVGSVGLLGLGMNHVRGLQALAADDTPAASAKAVIYIFLSGGLTQHDSFDPKPDAPDEIRGEFKPIQHKLLAFMFVSICPCWPNRATSGHWCDP